MLQFIFIIGLWSILTGTFYWLGKSSIANLSERKLIEIITSPIFNNTFRRKHNHRILHWSVVVLFVIGSLAIIAGALPFTFIFKRLQIWLFNTTNGIFIPHNFILFYASSLGIGIAIIVLILIFVMKKAPPIPLEKWNEFPSLETTLNRVKSIRNFGFALSIILQIAFVYGMYDYVIIEDDYVIRNPPERLKEKIIFYKEVEKVNVTYKYGRERSNRNDVEQEVLNPKFWIYTENDSFNIWYPVSKISTGIFQKTATKFYENKIKIDINYPGIKEQHKWKIDYSKKKYNLVMGVYNYVNRLIKGLEKNYQYGETVEIDDMKIRLDSAVFSNRQNALEFVKEEPLLIYFTVTNETFDTNYFGIINTLEVFDNQGNEYPMNLILDNQVSAVIPPKITVLFMRGYDVPKDKKGLKVKFTPSLFREKSAIFEIKINPKISD
jgi:hypothetical protein